MSNSRATKLQEMGTEIGRLTAEKNEAYGNSYLKCGTIMAILYPEGVKPAQYADMLSVVRIIDKLFRIATKRDAFGESPFRDIAGYGILGAADAPIPYMVADVPPTSLPSPPRVPDIRKGDEDYFPPATCQERKYVLYRDTNLGEIEYKHSTSTLFDNMADGVDAIYLVRSEDYLPSTVITLRLVTPSGKEIERRVFRGTGVDGSAFRGAGVDGSGVS